MNSYCVNTMRALRFFIVIVMVIGICLLTCGCIPQEEIDALIIQGRENVKDYVEGKYGDGAIIVDISIETGWSVWPYATGYVIAEVAHGSDVFKVYITGSESSTDGMDTRQVAQVREVLIQKLTECFERNTDDPAKQYIDLHWDFAEADYDGNDNVDESRYLKTYYDGENLSEVTEEMLSKVQQWRIGARVCGIDLKGFEQEDFVNDLCSNSEGKVKVQIVDFICQDEAENAASMLEHRWDSIDMLWFAMRDNDYVDEYLYAEAGVCACNQVNWYQSNGLLVSTLNATYCEITPAQSYGFWNDLWQDYALPEHQISYAIDSDAQYACFFVDEDDETMAPYRSGDLHIMEWTDNGQPNYEIIKDTADWYNRTKVVNLQSYLSNPDAVLTIVRDNRPQEGLLGTNDQPSFVNIE